MQKKSPANLSFFENKKALVGTIVATALAARAIFLVLFYNTFYWISLWSDAAAYNQWARRIVTTGDWLGQEPFFQTPVYPYFLALVYSVFGQDLLAVRVLQSLLGAGTAVIIFLIGDRLFSRKVGFAAGLLSAIYGPFLLSNNLLLVETLKIFLLVLTLLLCLIAQERRQFRWWLASGLALGLAIICRPTDFLVLGVIVIWVVAFPRWTAREKVTSLMGVLFGVFLMVAPVTLHNYLVSREFVLITTNGGLNFYLGNNPHAVGVYYNVDQLDIANDPDGRVYAEAVLDKHLKPSEVSSFWLSKATDFIRSEPAHFVKLLALKTLLFFHHKEISQLGYNYQFISATSIPLLSYLPTFLIVGPLGILGAILSFGRWKEFALLYGILAAQFLGVILFFVTDRYRLSAMPFFILFAAFALTRILDFLKKKTVRELAVAGAILLSATLVTTVLNVPLTDEFCIEEEYVGMMYFEAKQYNNALNAFQESLRCRDSYHIRNHMGHVYLAQGNFTSALAQYQYGYDLNPRQAISTFSIGTVYVSMRDWNSALKAFDKAIGINPRFAPAYLNKGLTLYMLEHYNDALDNLLEYARLEKDPAKLTTVWKDIENLKKLVQ